jgi:hypothetical protein
MLSIQLLTLLFSAKAMATAIARNACACLSGPATATPMVMDCGSDKSDRTHGRSGVPTRETST